MPMSADQMSPDDHWYPLVASTEVAGRHIFHAQLRGQEIAVWRDTAGIAHAWDNRCPHRGTRLTIARHLGDALVCRYHGWRFDVSGACTYVPAHPTQRPASVLSAQTLASTEAHGFIWASLGRPESLPQDPELLGQGWVLRSCVIHSEASRVEAAVLPLRAQEGLSLYLLPCTPRRTIVHGVFDAAANRNDRIQVLRQFDAQLCAIRDVLEAGNGGAEAT